jgi:signal transduction histidine kinase
MTLQRKLLLSMVLPALLLGMLGAVGIYSLRHLERAAGRILSDNYRSIQSARRLSLALRRLQTPEPLRPGPLLAAAHRRAAAGDLEAALRDCERNITEPGEREVLRRLRTTWRALRDPLVAGAAGVADPGRVAGLRSLHDDVELLVTLNERAMFAHERESRRVARFLLGVLAISALAAFLALALFAVISARRISRPVTEVADRLHLALNPDSQPSPGATGRTADEIARLREELDALLHRLSLHEDERNRQLDHLQGRLAFVMNEVLEGLVLLDADHRILAANRVGRTLLGMPAGEGCRVEELRPREDVGRLLAPVLGGEFQPERDLGELQFPVDGAPRVFRPRVLTVPGPDGAVAGYLLLFWDVTEQHELEESRRRFIAMLSHQLKTPLTSLSMAVNLIRERLSGAEPAQAELLAIASESCASLSTLVSDLIEAARETVPDRTQRPRRVDLVRLLRSALRPLQPQAEEKGVDLRLPAGDAEIVTDVDPVKFPWVVTNIAGNALRYTGRGGVVQVTVLARDGRIQVSVKDTGAGIAPENLERIFQPYVSLDPEPGPGTHGLGLAIAREIVEAHGGVIEAISAPGAGTEFRITLPAGRSAS